ncbi:hypothetical protein KF840_11485 [bacterium]|nr:hypothetical protein [bacterium]
MSPTRAGSPMGDAARREGTASTDPARRIIEPAIRANGAQDALRAVRGATVPGTMGPVAPQPERTRRESNRGIAWRCGRAAAGEPIEHGDIE